MAILLTVFVELRAYLESYCKQRIPSRIPLHVGQFQWCTQRLSALWQGEYQVLMLSIEAEKCASAVALLSGRDSRTEFEARNACDGSIGEVGHYQRGTEFSISYCRRLIWRVRDRGRIMLYFRLNVIGCRREESRRREFAYCTR
jgi:hypothetical protein